MVATTGDYAGTEINSDRMLWSMAGNLAMVYRVFMGMQFEANGIRFRPVVPKMYDGIKTLSGFKYRQATLNITVNGYGNTVQSILADGKPLSDAFFPATVTGTHSIEIQMGNNDFSQASENQAPNLFSLPTPQVRRAGNRLVWQPIDGATEYRVYKNGQFSEKNIIGRYDLKDISQPLAVYSISAVDRNGNESFLSEPLSVIAENAAKVVEIEDFAAGTMFPFTGFSGAGYVEISTDKNRRIECKVNVEEAGNYFISVRYSNGSGPWNTDNKCAIRSLQVNGAYAGVLVFPQRGKDEWSDWGFSNSRAVSLRKGENTLVLSFEDWNTNMNGTVNTAMLDYLLVTPKGGF